jgi:hypothetical protein
VGQEKEKVYAIKFLFTAARGSGKIEHLVE